MLTLLKRAKGKTKEKVFDFADRIAKLYLLGVGFTFFLISLIGLNGPFLNVHFERQNQSFDVARHIFQTGWEGIVIPKASFSMWGYTELPFTVVRLEFPFLGLLGWPFARIVGNERAVVRLIPIAFSLLSIYAIFQIIRTWLEPASAVFGAALWGFAPLVLHFGQVPMPDILCTTGLMLAFYLALNGRVWPSSAAFAFTVLAKETVLCFGLPVLVALLLARNKTLRASLRDTLQWMATPILALGAWLSLDRIGPPTHWTVLQTANDSSRGPWSDLLSPSFYLQSVGCLLPFGLGLIGVLGILLTFRNKCAGMSTWLKISVAFANCIYFIFVLRRVPEPQYFLPILFWLVIAASFGFQEIFRQIRDRGLRGVLVLLILVAHFVLVWVFTWDLKSSRVPDYYAIKEAAAVLPPRARVAVADHNYQAAPAVWFDRNVEFAGETPAELDKTLPYLESMNFEYLVLLDLESHHRRIADRLLSLSALIATVKLVFVGQNSRDADPAASLVNSSSPTRQYCDARFKIIFQSSSTVLYELPHRAPNRLP